MLLAVLVIETPLLACGEDCNGLIIELPKMVPKFRYSD